MNTKKRIGIIGGVVDGKSLNNSWSGRCTGSDTFVEEMGTEGDIEVLINSIGGSVFAGYTILNALEAAVEAGRKVDIYIAPLAASIAGYIGSGVKGANIYSSKNGKIVYHAPWSIAIGSKQQFRDKADLLEMMEEDLKAAIKNRGVEPQEEWFETGRMAIFNAKKAMSMGLIDGIKNAPSDLITAVSKPISSNSYWGKNENHDSKNKQVGLFGEDDLSRIAASMEFKAYMLSLCQEHYQEHNKDEQPIAVEDLKNDSFELIFKNGSKSLLNFERNSLNIVSIDWDSTNPQSTTENKMNVNKNKSDPKNLDGKEPVAKEPVAKEPVAKEPVAKEPVAKEPVAKKPVAKEPVAKEPVAKEPVAKEPSASLPPGMTEDMITFAAENYAKVKAEHVENILANPKNTFDKEELDGFSMKFLEKLSNLATVEKESKSDKKADNSLTKPPQTADGNSGSLPPPEL